MCQGYSSAARSWSVLWFWSESLVLGIGTTSVQTCCLCEGLICHTRDSGNLEKYIGQVSSHKGPEAMLERQMHVKCDLKVVWQVTNDNKSPQKLENGTVIRSKGQVRSDFIRYSRKGMLLTGGEGRTQVRTAALVKSKGHAILSWEESEKLSKPNPKIPKD